MDDPASDTQSDQQPPSVPPSTQEGLEAYKPDWQTDGYGLRGPQPERLNRQATSGPMEFGVGDRQNFSDVGKKDCKPPGGNTSKIYVRATHYTGGRWVC